MPAVELFLEDGPVVAAEDGFATFFVSGFGQVHGAELDLDDRRVSFEGAGPGEEGFPGADDDGDAVDGGHWGITGSHSCGNRKGMMPSYDCADCPFNLIPGFPGMIRTPYSSRFLTEVAEGEGTGRETDRAGH
jgi:hypothetical protein